MRGKPVRRKELAPDEKYNSPLVAKFINFIMQDGKKNVARGLVYDAFDILGKENKKTKPLETFEKAVDNVMPKVEVRSRRVGGANYQVPVPVADYRQVTLALRWIIDAARARRKTSSFDKALAGELLDAFNKSGEAFKKKEDTHRMAEANKAFAHFQW